MGRDAWLRRSSGSATDGGRSSLGMTRAPGQRALAPLLLVGGRWIARGGCGSHGGRWSAWWTPDRAASACVARARMSRASPCLGACVASARVPRTPCESFSRKLAKISSYVRSSARAWPSGCGRTRRADVRGTDHFVCRLFTSSFAKGLDGGSGDAPCLPAKEPLAGFSCTGTSCISFDLGQYGEKRFARLPGSSLAARNCSQPVSGGTGQRQGCEWRGEASAQRPISVTGCGTDRLRGA